jgi:hypothetical protein
MMKKNAFDDVEKFDAHGSQTGSFNYCGNCGAEAQYNGSNPVGMGNAGIGYAQPMGNQFWQQQYQPWQAMGQSQGFNSQGFYPQAQGYFNGFQPSFMPMQSFQPMMGYDMGPMRGWGGFGGDINAWYLNKQLNNTSAWCRGGDSSNGYLIKLFQTLGKLEKKHDVPVVDNRSLHEWEKHLSHRNTFISQEPIYMMLRRKKKVKLTGNPWKDMLKLQKAAYKYTRSTNEAFKLKTSWRSPLKYQERAVLAQITLHEYMKERPITIGELEELRNGVERGSYRDANYLPQPDNNPIEGIKRGIKGVGRGAFTVAKTAIPAI